MLLQRFHWHGGCHWQLANAELYRFEVLNEHVEAFEDTLLIRQQLKRLLSTAGELPLEMLPVWVQLLVSQKDHSGCASYFLVSVGQKDLQGQLSYFQEVCGYIVAG